jgi:hypothetical protein
MATLVSFPSRYTRVKHILLLTDQKRLRTINDHRDLIVDGLCGLQNLCSYHPDLFICQLVQPLQRIFNVSLPNQLLQVFF